MLEARLAARTPALDFNVSLTLPTDNVGALFGASGAGKTTLLRWIAGLEPQLRGQLRLGDTVLEDTQTRLPAHQRGIGMVFQHGALFPHLDVRGNLAFALQRSHADSYWLQRLMSLLDIEALAAQRPHQLSGGQVQRVALARALVRRPQLLLLDEPFANLDVSARQSLMTVLERLQQELSVTTLLVSHQPQEVQRLAQHLYLLEHGQLTASGPLQALLVDPRLPLAHLEDAAAVIHAEVGVGSSETLLQARFDGGQLVAPLPAATQAPVPGQDIRVAIAARDVSITLSAATDSSISNILPARIIDIGEDARPGQLLVRLHCGSNVLLARLTDASCQRLALAPGKAVFAQVKSVALLT